MSKRQEININQEVITLCANFPLGSGAATCTFTFTTIKDHKRKKIQNVYKEGRWRGGGGGSSSLVGALPYVS